MKKDFNNYFEVQQENGVIKYKFNKITTADALKVKNAMFKFLNVADNNMNINDFLRDENTQKMLDEMAIKYLLVSTEDNIYKNVNLEQVGFIFENPFICVEIIANFQAYIMFLMGNLQSFQQARN